MGHRSPPRRHRGDNARKVDGDAGATFGSPASPGPSAASPGCIGISRGSEEAPDRALDGSVVHVTGEAPPQTAAWYTPRGAPPATLPPPTARYPGALLTDEDAEGLRGSEVPREVPVPF